MFYSVEDFMYLPNLYVKPEDSLQTAFSVMLQYETKEIFVINDINEIIGTINKHSLVKANTDNSNTLTVKDIFEHKIRFISVYPQNNMAEVRHTMKMLNLKYLPVCKSPLDKRLLGFVKNECH